MAEVKEASEPTLPAKRKQFDPLIPDKDELDQPNKTQKTQSSNSNHGELSPTEAENASGNDGGQDFAPIFSIREEEGAGKADEINGIEVDKEEEDEEEENEEAAVVDRKGKGIMIEEEEEDSDSDDDDDDSSDDDDGSENGGGDDDSELEDDPLAEVDLDNILPSRTRRRGVQPGFYIANAPGIADEDDSDDSDA
ncbi:unnamed protein product [Linum trigynum]|uniref:Histone chaperone domain-containing protein n=1 Tax=Linum trigynum TaxID=586398 RepID=A0AAV2F065_9ROSI